LKTQVVAAIIIKDGKFLLGKRNPNKKSAPNYWCPVSGRMEADETEQEAVVREVQEEVGLIVVPEKKLFVFDSEDGSANIHWWLVRIVSGVAALMNDEHTEIKWVTIEEMKSLQPIFEDDLIAFTKVPVE
jgi:8-oxo-dGTP diphosphatase